MPIYYILSGGKQYIIRLAYLKIETIIALTRIVRITIHIWTLIEHHDGTIIHDPSITPMPARKPQMLVHPLLLQLLLLWRETTNEETMQADI